MARMLQWAALALIGSAAIGCVSQEKYNALKLDRDQYATRLSSAESAEQAAQAAADAYKRQLDGLGQNQNNTTGLLANQTQQIADLQRQLQDLNGKYEAAINRTASLTPALPPALNDALQSFANENPNLVDFDSARGIVKFKSDVTFAPGSAEVTSQAQQAIDRFAQILNSAAASSFELMVVGHTDNARVVNPATIKAGHRDNWYLSAHRAIAVSEVLQRDSVSPARLQVAGFADQRPVASNSTEEGKRQNRRVEVLILPTKYHGNVAEAVPAGASMHGHRQAARAPLMNKDVAEESPKPAFNK